MPSRSVVNFASWPPISMIVSTPGSSSYGGAGVRRDLVQHEVGAEDRDRRTSGPRPSTPTPRKRQVEPAGGPGRPRAASQQRLRRRHGAPRGCACRSPPRGLAPRAHEDRLGARRADVDAHAHGEHAAQAGLVDIDLDAVSASDAGHCACERGLRATRSRASRASPVRPPDRRTAHGRRARARGSSTAAPLLAPPAAPARPPRRSKPAGFGPPRRGPRESRRAPRRPRPAPRETGARSGTEMLVPMIDSRCLHTASLAATPPAKTTGARGLSPPSRVSAMLRARPRHRPSQISSRE